MIQQKKAKKHLARNRKRPLSVCMPASQINNDTAIKGFKQNVDAFKVRNM